MTVAKPVRKAPRHRRNSTVAEKLLMGKKPDQEEVFSLQTSEKKIGEDTTNSITSLKNVRFRPFEFPEIRQASYKIE